MLSSYTPIRRSIPHSKVARSAVTLLLPRSVNVEPRLGDMRGDAVAQLLASEGFNLNTVSMLIAGAYESLPRLSSYVRLETGGATIRCVRR